MKTLASNKKAFHDYTILETYEAGLKLTGNEVRSIKSNRASLKASFVSLKDNELFLLNAHVPIYQNHIITPQDPTRSRKLLLKKSEIKVLISKKAHKGLTLIPLKLYLKRGLIKAQIALVKGKHEFDKRQVMAQRQEQRDIDRLLRVKQ